MGLDNDDKLSFVIWGVIAIGVIGFAGFNYASNKNQRSSKLTFQEWIKKSPTSLSYLDTGNSSGTGLRGDDNNWYNLDFAARNCLEEMRLSMKISKTSSCKKGTLDYLVAEYKKYNPSGAIPRTLIANNTPKKTRKKVAPDPVSIQPEPQSLASSISTANLRGAEKSPTQTPYYNLRLGNGKMYKVLEDHLTCELKEYAPDNNSKPNYSITRKELHSGIKVSGPYFSVRCKSFGVITDLTGFQYHHSEPFRLCLETSAPSWRYVRKWDRNRDSGYSDWFWEIGSDGKMVQTGNTLMLYGGKMQLTGKNLSCALGGVAESLIREGEVFSNLFYLDKNTMKYVQKN